MTRLLILATFSYVLNVLPPVAFGNLSNNALADTAPERSPSKQRFQTAQSSARPETAPKRLQRTVPAGPKTQTDPPLRQQLQTPQRLLRPDILPQRLQQPTPAGPKAEIDPPRQVVTQGQPATFDSKSIADPDTPITVHQWSGPGGQTSNRQRFVVDTANLKPSTYPVTLIVRDRQRRQDRDSATLVVEARPRDDVNTDNRPPVARITPERREVQQGEWAEFDGRTSTDPDGKIRTWTWSLNDKRIDRQPSARIDTRRLDPGEYRVGLEVTDEQELTARDEALLVVAERPQYFDAALVELDVSPAETAPNEEVRIRAIVANRGKDRLRNILVRFETGGGGRIEEKSLSSLASGETREVTARWIPKSAGEQIVVAAVDPNNRLRETNEENNSSRRPVLVLAPPVVKIDPSPLEVSQGDRASFAGRITLPARQKRTVDKFFWRGPGNQTGQGPVFEFDTSGLAPRSYKVNLEITDSSGFKRSADTILIVRPAQVEVWLSADNQRPQAGQDVRFSGGIRPEARGVEYRFTFGDGEQTDWKATAEAVHRYETPGDYPVRLLARRAGAVIGSKSAAVLVNETAYTVTLIADRDSVAVNDRVMLTASVEPPVDNIEFQFRFSEDEETGWLRTPSTTHSYSRDGEFSATVMARIRGARVIPSLPVRIMVAKPSGILWLLLVGAALTAVAAAAIAYMRKARRARIGGGVTVVPQLNLEHLRVETQGKLNSGCEISLRTVRGDSRFEIEASQSILGGGNE